MSSCNNNNIQSKNMSCTNNNDVMNSLATSLISTTVDDISNDIGRINISKNVGDISGCFDISGREEEKISSKKGTSCDQKLDNIKTDYVSHNNEDIDMVSGDIGNDIDAKEICANCGKEGASNTCNKCKQVKYCNAACKKRHRHKHKKDCEEHLRRAAELREEDLRRVAEIHDERLFKLPPQREEDCPICFQRLPYLCTGKRYNSCCGKLICSGCIHAIHAMDNKICPFCRAPTPTTVEETIKQLMKRTEVGDVEAIFHLAGYYSQGNHYGTPQNYTKELELFHRAAELGHDVASFNIGNSYYHGEGVGRDAKKAMHHWELGAMRGNEMARHNLGVVERDKGNHNRAMRHFMIAMEGGLSVSLEAIKELFVKGLATKDDYTKALRAYQKYLGEIKSSQRDDAAAADEGFKYIG